MPSEKTKAAVVVSDSLFEFWLPLIDRYRTLCVTPTPEMKAVFSDIRLLALPD